MSRAARSNEHDAAVEQLQLAVQWALLHPCRDEYPAGWEDDHGLFTDRSTPGRTRCTAGRPVRTRLLRRRPRHHAGGGQAADRRRPRAHLPTPPPPGPRRRGAVPVWLARAISRETHDLSARSRRLRGPAHRCDALEDRPGRRRPARPRSPALLRPRPRHRRRGTRTHPTRRLATPPRQPRHHRRRDDPGHPRRPALRPDHRSHRRRARPARRHRPPRCPPGTGGRDPRRPPIRPRPPLRPRAQRPPRVRVR